MNELVFLMKMNVFLPHRVSLVAKEVIKIVSMFSINSRIACTV